MQQMVGQLGILTPSLTLPFSPYSAYAQAVSDPSRCTSVSSGAPDTTLGVRLSLLVRSLSVSALLGVQCLSACLSASRPVSLTHGPILVLGDSLDPGWFLSTPTPAQPQLNPNSGPHDPMLSP